VDKRTLFGDLSERLHRFSTQTDQCLHHLTLLKLRGVTSPPRQPAHDDRWGQATTITQERTLAWSSAECADAHVTRDHRYPSCREHQARANLAWSSADCADMHVTRDHRHPSCREHQARAGPGAITREPIPTDDTASRRRRSAYGRPSCGRRQPAARGRNRAWPTISTRPVDDRGHAPSPERCTPGTTAARAKNAGAVPIDAAAHDGARSGTIGERRCGADGTEDQGVRRTATSGADARSSAQATRRGTQLWHGGLAATVDTTWSQAVLRRSDAGDDGDPMGCARPVRRLSSTTATRAGCARLASWILKRNDATFRGCAAPDAFTTASHCRGGGWRHCIEAEERRTWRTSSETLCELKMLMHADREDACEPLTARGGVLEYELGVRAARMWLDVFANVWFSDAGQSSQIYIVAPCPFDHSTVL
jgi:hypothetical protein